MIPVRYHADAAGELAAAVDHYAARDVDLAVRFHLEVRGVESLVAAAPASYPVFERIGDVAIRRALLDDFPFALLFIDATDVIWVVAVMHLRREPGYWRARV